MSLGLRPSIAASADAVLLATATAYPWLFVSELVDATASGRSLVWFGAIPAAAIGVATSLILSGRTIRQTSAIVIGGAALGLALMARAFYALVLASSIGAGCIVVGLLVRRDESDTRLLRIARVSSVALVVIVLAIWDVYAMRHDLDRVLPRANLMLAVGLAAASASFTLWPYKGVRGETPPESIA